MVKRNIDRLYDGYIVSHGRTHEEYRTLTAAERRIEQLGCRETGTFVHEWPDGTWLQIIVEDDNDFE